MIRDIGPALRADPGKPAGESLRVDGWGVPARVEVWLPGVDSFRILVNCPPPAMLVVFQSLVLVVVPWV
jgi:hypothetical protein